MLMGGQVRGFVLIGMLEFWNIGIMGSGRRLGEDNGIMGSKSKRI
jgi:hypothetical protein